MPDDPKSDPTPDPKPDDPKTFTQADIDRIVADRLKREAAKYSDYDDLKAKAARLVELEEKDKTDAQRLADSNRALEDRAKKAELDACRMRIAIRKGLTEAQVKRLVGATEEELEADADELLEAFKAKDDQTPPSAGRPKEKLRPGAVPDAEPEETDPAKLAASVPRHF